VSEVTLIEELFLEFYYSRKERLFEEKDLDLQRQLRKMQYDKHFHALLSKDNEVGDVRRENQK